MCLTIAVLENSCRLCPKLSEDLVVCKSPLPERNFFFGKIYTFEVRFVGLGTSCWVHSLAADGCSGGTAGTGRSDLEFQAFAETVPDFHLELE